MLKSLGLVHWRGRCLSASTVRVGCWYHVAVVLRMRIWRWKRGRTGTSGSNLRRFLQWPGLRRIGILCGNCGGDSSLNHLLNFVFLRLSSPAPDKAEDEADYEQASSRPDTNAGLGAFAKMRTSIASFSVAGYSSTIARGDRCCGN